MVLQTKTATGGVMNTEKRYKITAEADSRDTVIFPGRFTVEEATEFVKRQTSNNHYWLEGYDILLWNEGEDWDNSEPVFILCDDDTFAMFGGKF